MALRKLKTESVSGATRIVTLSLFVSFSLGGCAYFRPGSTSVESVLSSSESIDADLVLEVDEVTASQGERTLASKRAAFQWPLRRIKLNSPFGFRDGQLHSGVDLKAHTGTPVYASLGGIVIYSGDGISGYGELVIVRHGGGYSTLYAHASHLLVSAGQRVTRGQCIAYSGDTGHASGPHLHFEVREGMKAVDPQPILMRRSLAGK